ncbi:hypothetical protein [Streptomyces sp. NPDC049813]|uniref:hypothetical protein n=1 Tax=Streptomyces sp. NPDC049813 TaxID=3365597 RepID=UPI0037872C8D
MAGYWGRRRAQRAALAHAAHREAQVRTAADIAISRAWRRTAKEPACEPSSSETVLVADVLFIAWEHFRIEASREEAAAVLRQRFPLRAGPLGLATDAFDESPCER